MRLLGSEVPVPTAVPTLRDALTGWAAPHAQLQVLLIPEVQSHFLSCLDGEGQVLSRLAHSDGGGNVGGQNFHVPVRRAFVNGQATPSRPLTAVHHAVCEGRQQVIYFCMVVFLIEILFHVLENDGFICSKYSVPN
uniref:Uncharacterized protein n=1 Tax=Salvator merianae TaxID=96440 RepID=A0A8D0C565_SALMN